MLRWVSRYRQVTEHTHWLICPRRTLRPLGEGKKKERLREEKGRMLSVHSVSDPGPGGLCPSEYLGFTLSEHTVKTDVYLPF